MNDLFIDIETFSDVDIKESGLYKYAESTNFRVLLISYALGTRDIKTVDLTCEEIPDELEDALFDETVRKHAHNATFERICLKRIGYDIPIEQWFCTAVKSSYCGLPISLDEVSKALDIVNKKMSTGLALIKYFSCPCKPTAMNGYRSRNMPYDSPAKWIQYKEYNAMDVAAEREIHYILEKYEIPQFERDLYILDQQINDLGILIDLDIANNAMQINETFSNDLTNKLKQLTGLENPNSVAQLKSYIFDNTGDAVTGVTKETLPIMIKKYDGIEPLSFLLKSRVMLGKSSVKKYSAMINCAGNDSRARGLFQFYGAGRTGRWAGRLIQLQNLPQNHIEDIELARHYVSRNDGEMIEMLYGNVPSTLSQLIRTAFIAKEDHIFHVADFSAIEARVVSWLASEDWRLEVFAGHGKIYEAAASRMFNVPIEMVTKGSDLRAKAKNAELALGYQGSLGAMKRMGGEKMGLSDGEMMSIVKKWRTANPKIVEMWTELDNCAIEAVMYKTEIESDYRGIKFNCDNDSFTIELPSGHKLFYRNPRLKTNRFGSRCITYSGVDQETKQWGTIETYGGKITENIVQAISRDILGYSMMQLRNEGFNTVMHVHDEVVCECVDHEDSSEDLENICDILGTEIPWAKDLPLKAEGFSTYFYKKD